METDRVGGHFMTEKTHCSRPDRDSPGILCGYPLPCPYHTVQIDTVGDVVRLIVPVSPVPAVNARQLAALKDIALNIEV